MAGQTVRISAGGRNLLRELASKTGKSMQSILDQALEDYRRKSFLEGLAADFAALRSDPQAWADELEERKAWDATLMDGLDQDERWTGNNRARRKGKKR